MSSAARKAFDSNLNDIDRLIDYYDTAETILKDTQRDLPAGADVVLRAALVLLITYWEAYLEDIVTEALEHFVGQAKDAAILPEELRKAVAREIKADKHELSPWKIAGEGWRGFLKARLPQLIGRFNTPKSGPTRTLIQATLGIADITRCWKVGAKSPEKSCQFLDTLVSIRGKIAHRGKLPKVLAVRHTKCATDFIRKVVTRTDDNINAEVLKATGQGLW